MCYRELGYRLRGRKTSFTHFLSTKSNLKVIPKKTNFWTVFLNFPWIFPINLCYRELGYRLRGRKTSFAHFLSTKSNLKVIPKKTNFWTVFLNFPWIFPINLCSRTIAYRRDHRVFLRDMMGKSSLLPVLVIITRVLGNNFLIYNL